MNEEKKVPFKWEYGEETISLQLGMYANNQRLYIGMITHTEDALTAAFTEYTSKKVKKAEKTERPSVLAKLSQFKEMVKNAVVDRTKRKELER